MAMRHHHEPPSPPPLEPPEVAPPEPPPSPRPLEPATAAGVVRVEADDGRSLRRGTGTVQGNGLRPCPWYRRLCAPVRRARRGPPSTGRLRPNSMAYSSGAPMSA